jgi:hypothetical protein
MTRDDASAASFLYTPAHGKEPGMTSSDVITPTEALDGGPLRPLAKIQPLNNLRPG